jgi:hypothetical protein
MVFKRKDCEGNDDNKTFFFIFIESIHLLCGSRTGKECKDIEFLRMKDWFLVKFYYNPSMNTTSYCGIFFCWFFFKYQLLNFICWPFDFSSDFKHQQHYFPLVSLSLSFHKFLCKCFLSTQSVNCFTTYRHLIYVIVQC